MNAESPTSWSQLAVCPSCGAAISADAQTCWLCQWDPSETIVSAEVVSEPPAYIQESTATRVALIVGIVALGVITVGVFAAAPGIGVLMGIVFVMATIAIAKGLRSGGPSAGEQRAIEQAYASPFAAATAKRGSVVVDVLKVLGIIALIGLASIIAFFTFCVICIIALNA